MGGAGGSGASYAREIELRNGLDALSTQGTAHILRAGCAEVRVVDDEPLQRHVVGQVGAQHKRAQYPDLLRRKAAGVGRDVLRE